MCCAISSLSICESHRWACACVNVCVGCSMVASSLHSRTGWFQSVCARLFVGVYCVAICLSRGISTP